jgi:hypothetical protein
MRARWIATGLALGLGLFGQGCGGVYYAAAVNGAASRVEEAREIGAETLAPYEYYYAKVHLEQAQVEASEASYGDAANYAEVAEEYAGKAIELSQAAHKAGGRE